jgi:hypothetical protein
MAPERCVKDLRLVLDEGQCLSVPSPPTCDTIIRVGAWQKDQLT